MKRIVVIGCGGSGKTHLSITLGRSLDIPVIHLDMLFWKPGWKASKRDEFLEAQRTALSGEYWIADGNYGGTMKERIALADSVLFLDLPTLTCLSGVIRRYFRFRNTVRPSMTLGNNGRLTKSFLLWILSYRRHRRPSILNLLAQIDPLKNVVVLKSRREVDDFILRNDGVTSI